MKKYIYNLLPLIFILFFSKGLAQTNTSNQFVPPNINTVPPEVYSLYKFTEIPVSNTTGVPNISIPITNVNLKGFNLPISLSYHSSGINLDEIASNVGLGWSLNAGGMISHQVIGKEDDIIWPIPQDRELDDSCPNCLYEYPDDYALLKDISNALNDSGGAYDTQPDIFIINVGDFYGKFFFDSNNLAHTIPASDIKIERPSFNSFLVIDEKGVKYNFQTVSLTRNINSTTSILGGGSSQSVSNSYYVTSIVTPNNERIDFEYEDYTYSYQNSNSVTRYKRDFDNTGLNECTCTFDPNGTAAGINGNSQNYPFEYTETTSSVTEVSAKAIKNIKINNSEQEISFIYASCPRLDLPPSMLNSNIMSTGSFALKTIQHKFNTTLIDEYQLNYKYFNLNSYQECISQSDNITKDIYRLQLASFTKNDVESYNLEYFENTPIPSRLSNSYDHWGKIKTNVSSSPFVLDYSYFYTDGTDRNPVLNDTKLGTLSKITYPTGGFSTFQFGLNQYYGTYNLYNPPTQKTASLYINGTQEFGIPNEPQYLSQSFTINNKPTTGPSRFLAYIVSYPDYPINGQTTNNWFNSSLLNTDTNQTYPLIYSNGQINYLDVPDGNYTVYVNGVSEGAGVGFNWIENNPQLTSEGNINVGGLRIEEIDTYTHINDTTPSLKAFYDYNQLENSIRSSGIIMSMPIYTYIQPRHRICSQIIDYNQYTGGEILQTYEIDYTYYVQNNKPFVPMNLINGNHIFYPEVKVFNEQNKTLGYTSYKYSYQDDDYSYYQNNQTLNGICQYPIHPRTSMDFLRGDLIEQKLYKKIDGIYKNVSENIFEYTSNVGSFFNDSNNNPFIIGLNLVKIRDEKLISRITNGGEAFPNERYPALYSLGYYKLQSNKKHLTKSIEKTFDSNGENALIKETVYNYSAPNHNQTTSQSVVNSLGDNYITKYYYAKDYQNISHPQVIDFMILNNMVSIPLTTQIFKFEKKLSEQITEYAKDATTSDLCLPKFIYTKKGDEISIPLEKKITYDLYDNKGNLKQYTIENAPPVSIIWGYNQTQPIAKIEGVSYINLPSIYIDAAILASNTATESELVNALNALRMQIPNAMISTYTYKPLIGVSTITDPKGDIQYYFYDNFNRLQYVKDKNGNILSENEYHYRQIVE